MKTTVRTLPGEGGQEKIKKVPLNTAGDHWPFATCRTAGEVLRASMGGCDSSQLYGKGPIGAPEKGRQGPVLMGRLRASFKGPPFKGPPGGCRPPDPPLYFWRAPGLPPPKPPACGAALQPGVGDHPGGLPGVITVKALMQVPL